MRLPAHYTRFKCYRTTSSNGLGYSTLDGKFYFFNKVGTGAAPSPQFASYNPVTTTLYNTASATRHQLLRRKK